MQKASVRVKRSAWIGRSVRAAAVVALALAVGAPREASAQGSPRGVPVFDATDVPAVFVITKSENRNEVRYGLRLDASCRPEGDAPVVAYWQDLEKGPSRRSPLLDHEGPAYGIAKQRVLKPARKGEVAALSVVLRAVTERPLTLHVTRDADGGCRAHAELRIAGKRAVLERVHAEVGFLSVKSLTLEGRDARTGAALRETLKR